MPPADALRFRVRPDRPRRLLRIERRVEISSACLFVLAAGILLALAPPATPLPAGALAAFLGAHALAGRVRVWYGAGSTVPTQLVLVPALFALPPSLVPPVVAAALAAAAVVDVARRREPPARIACAVGGAWHALAPAAVFALAGSPSAELGAAGVLAAALGAQFAVDIVISLLSERFGRRVPARTLAPTLLMVSAGDLVLAPVGFSAAVATDGSAAALLLVLPALGFLAALTHDRNARLVEAADRVEELRHERRRVADASRRLGRAFGSSFSREALVELVEASAADALGCAPEDVALELRLEPGRATGGGLLRRALGAAPLTGGCAALRDGDMHAIAHVLPSPADGHAGALAVVRRGRRFNPSERELLALLANQAAAGLENVTLQERVRRQAVTDELTGLANLRALRARLAAEVERAHRHDLELALVLIDLDHFKQVNDRHGHLAGDRVLVAVAGMLTRAARAIDLSARYGGEEMALLMPETGLGGALAAAERLRVELECLRVPLADGTQLGVTASFGAAAARGRDAAAGNLIAAADAGLYEAKRAGRNCVRMAASDAVRDTAG